MTIIIKARVLLLILALTAIEQGIKLYINSTLLSASIPVAAPWLYLRPVFNRDYSWFNSMLQLGIGKWAHIAGVSLILVFILLILRHLNKKIKTSGLIDAFFVFLIAGALCSLIDKVLWDGSLDYIWVKGFFTFDLKDVFINASTGILLLITAVNHRGIRKLSDKEILDFVKEAIRLK